MVVGYGIRIVYFSVVFIKLMQVLHKLIKLKQVSEW